MGHRRRRCRGGLPACHDRGRRRRRSAIAGAAAGKARSLHHRVEVEKELAGVITPVPRGILALVSAMDADAVAPKMPQAEQVKTVPVDEATAGAIKAPRPRLRRKTRPATPA